MQICMLLVFGGRIKPKGKKEREKVMAKKGLKSWVRANWVDIANRRPDGSFPPCGRIQR